MLEVETIKKEFCQFLKQFDIQNDKIKLKLIHTYQVMNTTDYLCLHEGITGEDHQLALVIALLHDIGRFKQLELTNSFDDSIIDHATAGIQLLFEDKLIEKFIKDRQYDNIIYHAIINHSKYKLPDIEDERILMHCQLIRDSDKLDNFRVKNTASIETLFSIEPQQFYKQRVSLNILNDIKNHRLILKEDRHNEADMWVSYFAFVFDFHFASSYRYLLETDYIHQNMERMHFSGGLKEDMAYVEKECMNYILEKTGENSFSP